MTKSGPEVSFFNIFNVQFQQNQRHGWQGSGWWGATPGGWGRVPSPGEGVVIPHFFLVLKFVNQIKTFSAFFFKLVPQGR